MFYVSTYLYSFSALLLLLDVYLFPVGELLKSMIAWIMKNVAAFYSFSLGIKTITALHDQ